MNLLSLGAGVPGIDVVGALKGAVGTGGGRAQFELRIGPFVQRELEVVRFTGREKLNAPYAYDVEFAASVPAPALQAGVFGLPACLSIVVHGHEPRVIQGLAVRIEAVGATDPQKTTKARRYRTKIVPRLWLLNHRQKRRVFQDKTAVEIARAVLHDAGIVHTFRLTTKSYPPIPFVYQRDETDLTFLTRVLATAGIFFYFEHASGLLDDLLPGAGAVTSLAGTLGGSAVTGALNDVGSATKTLSTMVLTDASVHTCAMADASIGGSVGAGLVGAAMPGVGNALSSAMGSFAGGAAASALAGLAAGIGSGDAVSMDDGRGASTAEERVLTFALRKEVRPKAVHVRERDIARHIDVDQTLRGASVSASADVALAAGMDLLGHAGISLGASVDVTLDALPIATADVTVGEYQQNAGLLAEAGRAYAEKALAQLRNDFLVGLGTSNCRRLAPGYRFKLARHPIEHVNREYVVTELRAEGVSPDHTDEGGFAYRNRFRTVPSSVDPLPRKPAPAPAFGLEVARVIGPVYGDVHTDRIGRILVRFRWGPGEHPGTGALEDGEAVCWVHWMERWAGDGFGTLTLPRVGTEVLVDFLQHEGGRPIAVGQLYSHSHEPPFDLPREGLKVGIRSRAAPPGVGGSEIYIDDDPYVRSATISAGNDLLESAGRDAVRRVGRDESITVDGARRESICGDSSVTVRGLSSVHLGAESVAVDGSSSTVVNGPNARRITGDDLRTVGGASKCVTAGDIENTIGGRANVTVDDDAVVLVRGVSSVDIGDDEHGRVSFSASEGSSRLSVTGELVIYAGMGLTLRCGRSVLRLRPDGVTVITEALDVRASSSLALSAPETSIVANNTLTAASATIDLVSTKGAEITLGADANVTGTKVKLGSGSSSRSNATDGSAKADDDVVKIRFSAQLSADDSHESYRLVASDGSIDITLPRSAGETKGDEVVLAFRGVLPGRVYSLYRHVGSGVEPVFEGIPFARLKPRGSV